MILNFCRRATLFSGLILSGGLLFIPRVPLLIVFLVLSILAKGVNKISFALIPGLVFSVFVLLLEFGRTNALDGEQVVIRAANFISGLVLLNIYYNSGVGAFRSDLYAIIKWFPAQAILTSIFATVAPNLFFQIPGTDTQTLLYILNHHTSDTDISFGFVRPDGFFWEPGVFQIYLNICLYLGLFVIKSFKTTLMALLAVVCTLSTTGILISAILLFANAISKIIEKNNKGKFFSLIVVCVFLIPILYFASANFVNKTEGQARGSYLAREYDTLTGLNIALEHPWSGIGFDIGKYMSEVKLYGSVSHEIDTSAFGDRLGNSNGLIQALYSLGFLMGGFLILSLARQKFFVNNFIMASVLFLSIFSEPLIFTPFFLMLIFSGMTKRNLPLA